MFLGARPQYDAEVAELSGALGQPVGVGSLVYTVLPGYPSLANDRDLPLDFNARLSSLTNGRNSSVSRRSQLNGT